MHRPTGDVDGYRAVVVQLDEVIGVGRARVATTTIDLADDDLSGNERSHRGETPCRVRTEALIVVGDCRGVFECVGIDRYIVFRAALEVSRINGDHGSGDGDGGSGDVNCLHDAVVTRFLDVNIARTAFLHRFTEGGDQIAGNGHFRGIVCRAGWKNQRRSSSVHGCRGGETPCRGRTETGVVVRAGRVVLKCVGINGHIVFRIEIEGDAWVDGDHGTSYRDGGGGDVDGFDNAVVAGFLDDQIARGAFLYGFVKGGNKVGSY